MNNVKHDGMKKAFRPGWILFGEYCRVRGIRRAGNERKILTKMSIRHKFNIAPTAKKPIYAVMIHKADELFVHLFNTADNKQ